MSDDIKKICIEAAKLLQVRNCVDLVVIARCPETGQMGFVQIGNRLWNSGACETAKVIMTNQVAQSPKNLEQQYGFEDPEEEEDDDDDGDWWKKGKAGGA